MPSVPDSAHVPGSEPTRGEADYDHNHVFPGRTIRFFRSFASDRYSFASSDDPYGPGEEESVSKSPNMIPLSIVIATFNRSAYLLRTLESLAGQTLPAQEFEILVVNNNSTDDTPAVFAGFARQHPELRPRMVAEPVQGISYARTTGESPRQRESGIASIDDDEEAVPDFAKSYRDSLPVPTGLRRGRRGGRPRCTRLRCPAGDPRTTYRK